MWFARIPRATSVKKGTPVDTRLALSKRCGGRETARRLRGNISKPWRKRSRPGIAHEAFRDLRVELGEELTERHRDIGRSRAQFVG